MTTCIRTLASWRAVKRGRSVGFVPTMGALHAGHVSLIRRARQENETVVVSIFVNPTQFNNPEDLQNYPRVIDEDIQLCKQAGADYLLLPSEKELYRDEYRYRVTETAESQRMEGVHRPGHFDGMLTVVLKLLQWVRPTRAYFGEKDYQQLVLVRGMASAFFLESEIIGCPTVREADGLAMSSRNRRLHPEARRIAPRFYELLRSDLGVAEISEALTKAGFKVDYVEQHEGRRYGAVFLDNVRLIDNVPIENPISPKRIDRVFQSV